MDRVHRKHFLESCYENTFIQRYENCRSDMCDPKNEQDYNRGLLTLPSVYFEYTSFVWNIRSPLLPRLSKAESHKTATAFGPVAAALGSFNFQHPLQQVSTLSLFHTPVAAPLDILL